MERKLPHRYVSTKKTCLYASCTHVYIHVFFVKVCTHLLCSWGMSRHESLEVPAGCELSHGQTQSHGWHPKFFSQKRMVQHATTIDNPQLFRLICGFITLELPSTCWSIQSDTCAAGVQGLAVVPCCELWQTGLCCSKTFEQLYSLTSIFVSQHPVLHWAPPAACALVPRTYLSFGSSKALPKYQRHLSDSCSNSFGSVWVCLEISGNRTIMNHIPQNCLFEWENDDWW